MNGKLVLLVVFLYFAPGKTKTDGRRGERREILTSSFAEIYFRTLYQASWKEYQGEWAVVTGASYGIGRETALRIASKGLNVIVTGRTAKVRGWV
jgi:hypothetical protein